MEQSDQAMEPKTEDSSVKPKSSEASADSKRTMMLGMGMMAIILLLVLLICIMAFMMGNPFGQEEEPDDVDATPTPTEVVEPTDVTTVTPTPTPADGPLSEEELGETVTDDVIIYFVDAAGTYTGAEAIGCGDKLIGISEPISGTSVTPIETALLALFNYPDDTYAGTDFLNTLTESSLTIDSITIDGTTANVDLSGSLISAGHCGDPRVQEQIEGTITQFDWINDANVTINGETLDEYFDLRG